MAPVGILLNEYLIYYKATYPQERQKERKAKRILLLAIPDEYQLRLHTIKDAKSLWAAIKSRFGGNVESKKMQKNVLKQQFKNFSVSDTKGIDKAYDRFQKLISQLKVHGEAVSNEDANQKFLRALPSSWNNIALIIRNKEGSSGSSSNSQNVAFLSAEDTNNINEVNTTNGVSTAAGHNSQGQASSSLYTDDLIFSFFANQSNSPQLDDEDLEQIDHDDLEEMDLKWQVAMLSMRVKRFYKKTGRKLIFNGKEPVSFDKTKVEYFNCHRSRDNTRRTVLVETLDALVVQDNALIMQDGLGYDWSYIAQDEPTEFSLMAYTSGSDTELGLESVEAQLIVHQKNEAVYEEKITVLEFEVKDKGNAVTRLTNQLEQTLKEKEGLKDKLEQFETSSNNLNKLINSQISSKDKTGLGYGDQLNENDSSGSELFNSVFDSRSSDGNNNQTNDRFKKDNGYHVVPPPLTRNYMPPLADLSFVGLDDSVYRPTANKTSVSVSQVETSITPPSNTSVEMPRVESVRPSGVIIEDWVSDDDDDIFQSNDVQTTIKPSFKKIEFTKARNKRVKSDKQAVKPRMVNQSPKMNDSGGSTARSMPLRDEEDPIEYGSDAGSTGNNILRMVNTRQGGDQPNIAAIIAEQLQNIIPQIVTQVTANVKQCLECMVAVRGRDAAKWDAHGMTLKAFCLVEEFALVMIWRSLELNYEPQNVQPTTIQSAVLRAGILTDEAISCGTLSKGSEKGRDDEVATSGGILRGD
ncbi:hypothetical protein Tco_0825104 [Tanacetum coccineum]